MIFNDIELIPLLSQAFMPATNQPWSSSDLTTTTTSDLDISQHQQQYNGTTQDITPSHPQSSFNEQRDPTAALTEELRSTPTTPYREEMAAVDWRLKWAQELVSAHPVFHARGTATTA